MTGHRGMTLLVVEDDAPIRALILSTVPEHWAVVEAADGIEALVLAREHRPDAILLDHHLPLLTGMEVCQTLRAEPWAADVRIIALTASADPAVRDGFTVAGADAFLAKPFSPMQLLDMLELWEAVHG